ncbi:MAG: nitronate monooxygenase [Oligoflexia bacterium]|nr:nitronate monooxygenase [Oligoflexia bacterium]
MENLKPIQTSMTKLLGIQFPIIAGPMFLVSNEDLVSAVSNSGALGATPSLNWRTPELFSQAVETIKAKTSKPYGINLIVNKSNPRVNQDLDVCVKHKVPLVITSLGNPKEVIDKVHGYGGKVFCDVVDLKYALKVQDLGCDGVIAVSQGAGGHAGPISPLVLLPHLKSKLRIPVIAAGGIASGNQILAALILGADGVQIGTRFIATPEAGVTNDYKEAIVKAEPEDIVMTRRISGTPAAVIKTPYIEKVGLDLNPIEGFLLKNPWTKKYVRMVRYVLGQNALEKAAHKTTWKTVWSAGQGVGLIHDIIPAGQVVQRLVKEYWDARENLP